MLLMTSACTRLSLLSCLFFMSSAVASPTSVIQRYQPSIGFEHHFTRYQLAYKTISKYTPRFYLSIMPIQTKNYQFGIETAYYFPASYSDHYQDLKSNSYDLFLSASMPMRKNASLFLKPGIEYSTLKYRIEINNSYTYENNRKILYPVIKTGIQYYLNDHLNINIITGSRFKNIGQQGKISFIFTSNIQYTF